MPMLQGGAKICGEAMVYGRTFVYGNARCLGYAKVFDNAKVRELFAMPVGGIMQKFVGKR